MALFKQVLRALVGLAMFFVLIGLALPKRTHIEREIVIDRPPAEVFAMLDSYRRFNMWSPWFARDPNAVYTYEGPSRGVGASMRWVSRQPDVGSGRQTIVESVPNKRVVTRLQFEGQKDARATFELTPQGQGTRLVWGFDAEHGMNPLSRWFGLFFDRLIGPDYEQGLAKLKATMERQTR